MVRKELAHHTGWPGWVGRAPGGLVGVGKPSQRSDSGWAALRRSRIGTGGRPGGPGGIGRPSEGMVGVGRASRLSSIGWEALLELQQGLGGPPRGPGGPSRGQEGVGRPSWRS